MLMNFLTFVVSTTIILLYMIVAAVMLCILKKFILWCAKEWPTATEKAARKIVAFLSGDWLV